jgi:hypothetical protein
MQKQIFFLLCMIMLFTGSALGQPKFSGESDPFVFNTQDAQAVPLTPLAVVLTLLLVTSFMLYRFGKQKRNANA